MKSLTSLYNEAIDEVSKRKKIKMIKMKRKAKKRGLNARKKKNHDITHINKNGVSMAEKLSGNGSGMIGSMSTSAGNQSSGMGPGM